jgi:hypothetical protein
MYGGHKHHKDVEVDSHAIAHVLAEQPDTEKALQSINAAYALIWYDVENKKLNLIRNKDRPLAHTADHNAWFITSETEIMDFVMTRVSYNKQPKPSVGFPVGNMHTWTLNGDKSSTLSYKDVDHEYKFQKTHGTASQSDDEYACAWGYQPGFIQAVIYGQHTEEPKRVENSSVLVLNPQPPEIEYFIGLKRVPEWQGTFNYTTLMSLRRGQYRDGAVLRVVVEDIIAYPGYTDGDFIFVSKPRAFNQQGDVGMFDVPILFRVDKKTAESCMEGEGDKGLVFYVTIRNHGWNPVTDNGQGYMILWADDPKEVVVSSVKQQVFQQQQQLGHSVH